MGARGMGKTGETYLKNWAKGEIMGRKSELKSKYIYKGNIMVSSRTSPNSLYDEEIATMEGGGSYNQDDAEGFLRIQGLPSRVQGRVSPRKF